MKALTIVGVTVLLGVLAGSAAADWQVGDFHKMHFPQLPDLQQGMNVLATDPIVLADDFMCSETGLITDVHIWGSWLDDIFPMNPDGTSDPGNMTFRLSIHSDIPADQSTTGYSMPGELLWEQVFPPGDFRWQFWVTSQERFFDPEMNRIMGADSQVFQYNFCIDPNTAANPPFEQIKDTIYWLDVSATPGGEPGSADALWGWKTSADHWNDDSVWIGDLGDGIDGDTSVVGPWFELIDPECGFSLDQAFVITPEPGTLSVLLIGSLGALLRRRSRRGH